MLRITNEEENWLKENGYDFSHKFEEGVQVVIYPMIAEDLPPVLTNVKNEDGEVIDSECYFILDPNTGELTLATQESERGGYEVLEFENAFDAFKWCHTNHKEQLSKFLNL
ncbi:MAG: hypothetical protein HRT47_01710 [Candidatus Caenarcaniphilales bacterium]|nr:hypothetical protein [Candidatus Caenarcaniphilales bacterium]